MNKKALAILTGLILFCLITEGQEDSFTGTFMNASSTISLRFKPMENQYHGLLQTDGGNFAMKSTVAGNLMTGIIYAVQGAVEFSASINNSGLVFTAFGYTDHFFKLSAEHEIGDVDLTPYMTEANTGNQSTYTPSTDYDYSYSQHDRGYATENKETYNHSTVEFNSNYPVLEDNELFNLIAGSQVVYYTRTSYVNDNVASSITYVNLCRNGTFQINYDGSFSVEGYYGGNAQGATHGQNSGIWKLISYEGRPAVLMQYNNGNEGINPIDKNRILQGRWRIGNTQYAIQRNKVNCR